MDPNAACRLFIHIPAYEQHVENGRHEYYVSSHKNWVRDKDTISWMDFYADLDEEIKHGRNQSLSVTFWDKIAGEYKEIVSDATLLAAFEMFDWHYNIMKKASPKAMRWIEENHKHLWTRADFSTLSSA
jgi:hypothetical protein